MKERFKNGCHPCEGRDPASKGKWAGSPTKALGDDNRVWTTACKDLTPESPQIIHEDDAIIVIDKPSSMPSVSLRNRMEGTLASWIIKNWPGQTKLENGKLEAGLIHRLDNDTSGVIIVAKTQKFYDALRKSFDDGDVEKEYIALVVGAAPKSGRIDKPIAHHPRKKTKMIVCDGGSKTAELGARPAYTEFKVREYYELSGEKGPKIYYTLLDIKIITGVRHQIRVHMASIGHPIAGDRLYQNPKVRDLDKLKIKGHFLHAGKISFKHPLKNNIVSFESELPDNLREALSKMKSISLSF